MSRTLLCLTIIGFACSSPGVEPAPVEEVQVTEVKPPAVEPKEPIEQPVAKIVTPSESSAQKMERLLKLATQFEITTTSLPYDDRETQRITERRILHVEYELQQVDLSGPEDTRVWLMSTVDWSSPFVLWFEEAPDHIFDITDGKATAYSIEAIKPMEQLTKSFVVRFLNKCPSGKPNCFVFGKGLYELEDAGAPGGWKVTNAKSAPRRETKEPEIYTTRDAQLDVHAYGKRSEIFFRGHFAFAIEDIEETWNHWVSEIEGTFYVMVQSPTDRGYEIHLTKHRDDGTRFGDSVHQHFELGTKADIHCWVGLETPPSLILQNDGKVTLGFAQHDGSAVVYGHSGSKAQKVRVKSAHEELYAAYLQVGSELLPVKVCSMFEGKRDCFPESL